MDLDKVGVRTSVPRSHEPRGWCLIGIFERSQSLLMADLHRGTRNEHLEHEVHGADVVLGDAPASQPDQVRLVHRHVSSRGGQAVILLGVRRVRGEAQQDAIGAGIQDLVDLQALDGERLGEREATFLTV